DFARWVQTEVRDAFWARAARDDLGVEVPADAAADVRSRWLGDVARWQKVLGIAEGMTDQQVRTAALRGASLGGQEALITRSELRGIRPLLRTLYPVVDESLASSSEMRNSDSTR
ncbi:MAG TPA: hypothetical protein VFI91_05945, partial [Longimicrobiaceae bacterium]|nr:hypothetical protein [Longimicrobiaceae bacterium]